MSATNPAKDFPSMPSAPLRDWRRVGWEVARVVVVLITVALLGGLVLRPTISLRVLWTLLIPILPASFLIAPQLWRGVCPLATFNQWTSGLLGHRQLGGRFLIAFNAVGILLLVLLVPARHFLLNENGPALAAVIVIVAMAALILGAFFDGRAGFCNGVCPILPVERFYGQHPLWKLNNHRCDPCSCCITQGCLEQDPSRSFAHAIRPTKGPRHWLTTSYGVFAGFLPGFIVGYYTTSDVPWSQALDIYLWIALCSAVSYVVATVVVRSLGLSRPVALALLAASAVALYYWWAAPLIAKSLHLPVAGAYVGRGAALALVAFWLVRAWPHLRADPG